MDREKTHQKHFLLLIRGDHERRSKDKKKKLTKQSVSSTLEIRKRRKKFLLESSLLAGLLPFTQSTFLKVNVHMYTHCHYTKKKKR